MQEYRAAPPSDARMGIVVDLDNEIIQVVVAPEPVSAQSRVQPHRLIVVPAGRIFTPGVFRSDGAHRQKCAGTRMAVGSPPQLPRPERAFGGAAIPFAFVSLDAAASQRHRYGLSTRRQP